MTSWACQERLGGIHRSMSMKAWNRIARVCTGVVAMCWGSASAQTQTGACCLPGAALCQTLTEAQCTAQGGVFHGAGSSCNSTNCIPTTTGACCLGGLLGCQVMSQTQCASL